MVAMVLAGGALLSGGTGCSIPQFVPAFVVVNDTNGPATVSFCKNLSCSVPVGSQIVVAPFRSTTIAFDPGLGGAVRIQDVDTRSALMCLPITTDIGGDPDSYQVSDAVPCADHSSSDDGIMHN